MRSIDADALKEYIKKTDLTAVGRGALLQAISNMPTLTPPNEQLTLEQLREMGGEPVVINGIWCYLEKIVDGIAYCWRWYMDFADEWPLEQYRKTWTAHRRPPKGEEEA